MTRKRLPQSFTRAPLPATYTCTQPQGVVHSSPKLIHALSPPHATCVPSHQTINTVFTAAEKKKRAKLPTMITTEATTLGTVLPILTLALLAVGAHAVSGWCDLTLALLAVGAHAVSGWCDLTFSSARTRVPPRHDSPCNAQPREVGG
jgi:hypothetical protein